MVIVDYCGIDYKGQKTEGTHKVSAGVTPDTPSLIKDIKKWNTQLRKVTIQEIRRRA